MPFVVDNVVVCDGSLANQSTGYTDTITRRLLDDTAVTLALCFGCWNSPCACNVPSRRRMLRSPMPRGRPAWALWPDMQNSHRSPRPSAHPDAPRRP